MKNRIKYAQKEKDFILIESTEINCYINIVWEKNLLLTFFFQILLQILFLFVLSLFLFPIYSNWSQWTPMNINLFYSMWWALSTCWSSKICWKCCYWFFCDFYFILLYFIYFFAFKWKHTIKKTTDDWLAQICMDDNPKKKRYIQMYINYCWCYYRFHFLFSFILILIHITVFSIRHIVKCRIMFCFIFPLIC